jgi:hypothetical protein
MITRACVATVAVLSVMALASPAQARITVTRADYKGGVLVVHGRADAPLLRVTLDERYNEWTNEAREFRFRLRYLPANCRVRLEANDEVRMVPVAGCKPLGKPSGR